MIHRKKPGVAFWATVVVVVVAVYVASIGPAYWACSDARGRIRCDWSGAIFVNSYAPIVLLYQEGPSPARQAISWYLGFWGMP
jgi:hypothetical protein